MSRDPREHLTEDEVLDFILEEFPAEEEAAVDQHLARCVTCAQQLEDFYTAQEAFPAAQWATQRNAFVATLRQRLFPGLGPMDRLLEQLRAFLASVSYSLAFAPQFRAPAKPWDCESDDGLFGVSIEDVNGDVTVHIDAQEPALAGVMIRLSAGTWQRDVRLERVDDEYVGAKVVIPRDERAQLPPDAVLRARLVVDAQETEQASS